MNPAIPVALYCVFIFLLSSLHGRAVPPEVTFNDKVLHAILYSGLGVLVVRAMALKHGRIAWYVVPIAVLFAAIYGASDEWHQSFVPGRDTDVWDLVADIVGAWCGAIGYAFYYRQQVRRLTCNIPSEVKRPPSMQPR